MSLLCVPSRPAVALIRKLIAVLESIERLPLHLYDTPGSTYNLQVILQKFTSLLLKMIIAKFAQLREKKSLVFSEHSQVPLY